MALNVELPLFLGGSLIKDIERTNLEWMAAREANLQERQSLARDVTANFRLVGTAVAQVSAQQRLMESSERALESSQLGYTNGIRTILDVLAAQQTVSQAKRNYARSRHDYVRRYVSLLVRAGIQDERLLKDINLWFVSGG